MARGQLGCAAARCGRLAVTLGGLLLLQTAAVESLRASDPGRGPPSDTGPPAISPSIPRDGPPALLLQTAANGPPETDRWHPNLIRERPVEVRLRSARKELQTGNFAAGLAQLQTILDLDEDVFIRLDDEPVPTGAHQLASRLLSLLPPDGLKEYQSLYGGEARRLLDEARQSGDMAKLTRVLRRFYHTPAGFEAGDRLAVQHLDRGCPELASAFWLKVLRDPVHAARVTPQHRMKVAYCLQRLGRTFEAEKLLAPFHTSPVTIAGHEVRGKDWLTQVAGIEHARYVEANTPFAGGRADRNGSVRGTAPFLARPIWTQSLSGEQSAHIATLATAWETYQIQNGLPIGAAPAPILVAGSLIFRDFEGLRAVDVSTGAARWFYRTATSLSQEITTRHTGPSDGNPDPNNVMRHLVGNALLGQLSSDGRLVFALDQIESDDLLQTASSSPIEHDSVAPRKLCNRLLALHASGGGGEQPISPQWIAGGRSDTSPPRAAAGHYFLGPPLPIENRLYAISEAKQQIHLLCLRAETGELLWSQVIASVPHSIGSDYHRAMLPCSPSYLDGVLVCPTQAGVLAAVDPTHGRLLWACSLDDLEPHQRQQMTAWPYSTRKRFGHTGYPAHVVLHQNSILYLPPHSESLHCLDLQTGVPRWRVRRDESESQTATEYVAAASDETILLVGRRRCRGLVLDTGSERWSRSFGSAVAGRGITLDSNYLVPLENGDIVALDVLHGRQTGTSHSPSGTPLGNLLAGNGLVVSMNRANIAAFPQAGLLLSQLTSAGRVSRPVADPRNASAETGDPSSSTDLIQIAELQLAMGRRADAINRLRQIQSHPPAHHSSPATHQVEPLLRDALFAELAEPTADRDAIFAEIAAVAHDPEQRGRLLLEQIRYQIERGQSSAARMTARELLALKLSTQLTVTDDPSRRIAAEAYVAGVVPQLQSLGEEATRPAHAVDEELTALVRSGDPAALKQFILLGGHRPQVETARNHLARILADRGQSQPAELLLFRDRDSSRLEIAAEATRQLAELWNDRGLYHAAGLMLDELHSRFPAVHLNGGQTGNAYLAEFPRDRLAWEAYRRLSPPVWNGSGVRIVEDRRTDDALHAAYNGNGIELKTTPRTCPFDVFDKGRGTAGLLSFTDRHTGVEYPETVSIPGRYLFPAIPQVGNVQHSFVGNFVPIGGTGAVHGLSLLERKLLWTTVPAGLKDAREVIRVGPAGPGYCVFQHKHHLFVCDPADGHVLWHRDDLEPTAGLMADPAGIIGDERVLAVFASNGSGVTVYDTVTGSEIRRGKLDIQTRLGRRSFGRLLFHYAGTADERRLRVWDPLSDRTVWEVPGDEIVDASMLEGVSPGTKVLSFVRDTDEIAWVTRTGVIRVHDVPTGEVRFEVALDAAAVENISYLRAFRDRERYYFNIQRSYPPGKAPLSSGHWVSDLTLPAIHVQGDLLAADRATHQILWQRPLGNRSILQLSDFRLPVLVTLSRVRRGENTALAVEVLDIRTGETFASRDDILSDRLLQFSYERTPGLIELRGAKTQIRLEFPTNVARAEGK